MDLSLEEVELLLHVARDATLGTTFHERLAGIGDALSTVIPNTSLSAMVVDPAGGEGDSAGAYMFFRNGDPSKLRDYLLHYMPSDPLAPFIANADGRAYVLSDHMARFGRDEFSADFLARHEPPIRFIMSCPQHALDGKLLMISFQRERALGDFTRREREILRLIGPDLARAARTVVINDKVARLAAPRRPGAPSGALVCTAEGEVLHADSGALELLGRLDRGGPPHESLIAEIRSFSSTGKSSSEQVFELGDRSWLKVKYSAGDAGPLGRSVVVIVERLEGAAARAAFLGNNASLTDREREVVDLVIQGLGNRQIGIRLGISPITVGVHLTGIYAKMGVSGRTELAAHILRGAEAPAR